jgi:shikimate kinase
LKRDPHDQANKHRKSENAEFEYHLKEVSRSIKLAAPRQEVALAMNIVLIGYRCTGKTSVGRILSYCLGKEFVDSDVLIEKRAGCSIERMVAEDGWDRFRRLEGEVIADVSIRDEQVIATGGGIVMDWRNVENLGKKGRLIWLQGDAEVIKKRMYNDRQAKVVRPSLTGVDPLEEIRQVLSLRVPLYERAASFAVDTSGSSIRDVAETIIRHLAEEGVRS